MAQNAALRALARLQEFTATDHALSQPALSGGAASAVIFGSAVPLAKQPAVRAALESIGALTLQPQLSNSSSGAAIASGKRRLPPQLSASGKRLRIDAPGVLAPSDSIVRYSTMSGIELEPAAAPAAPVSATASRRAATHPPPAREASRSSAVAAAEKSASSANLPPQAKPVAVKGATAGPLWFDMPAAVMTEELKRELTILRSRTYLDPKRHYKTAGEESGANRKKLPKFVVMATVQETPAEQRSGAISRKFKNASLSQQLLLGDAGQVRAHAAKNYAAHTAAAEAGGRKSLSGRKFSSAPGWKKRAGLKGTKK